MLARWRCTLCAALDCERHRMAARAPRAGVRERMGPPGIVLVAWGRRYDVASGWRGFAIAVKKRVKKRSLTCPGARPRGHCRHRDRAARTRLAYGPHGSS